MFQILNKKLVTLLKPRGSESMEDVRYLDLSHIEDTPATLTQKIFQQIPKMTKECETFVRSTQKGVDTKVAPGELEKLLKVMRYDI